MLRVTRLLCVLTFLVVGIALSASVPAASQEVQPCPAQTREPTDEERDLIDDLRRKVVALGPDAAFSLTRLESVSRRISGECAYDYEMYLRTKATYLVPSINVV